MSSERREALEDACRVLCPCCARGDAPQRDFDAYWMHGEQCSDGIEHGYGGVKHECYAGKIRSLIEMEGP